MKATAQEVSWTRSVDDAKITRNVGADTATRRSHRDFALPITGVTSTGGSEREGEILAPAREWPRRPAPRLGVEYWARAIKREPATARPLSMRSRSFPDSHASRAATVPQLSLDRQIDGHTD